MANLSDHQRKCVFVGNIPYHASEEEIVKKCQEIGPVVSFRLMIDKESGKRKGYAFCEYRDEETASSAIRNLKGQDLRGRKLRVDFAASSNNKDHDKNRKNGDCNNNENQNQFGSDHIIDPLTQHLANMSRNQLIQIVFEMNELAAKNPENARQLLLTCPGLPKAIYQAQILLGIVPPQILPNISQDSALVPQLPAESGDSTRSDDGDNVHPSRRVRLNDGRRAVSTSTTDEEEAESGSIIDNQVRFSHEAEANLLMQVKNLTAEQISLLPPHEQQKVIQLRQMVLQVLSTARFF
ncbi:hypothetical protein ACH5RR_009326 [Cinchona calisaya]|uniref:RRM domain-containing protein n=1 Tax=Cinchona calisaya TaxID=153742 RepID=A0ABD3AED2_9GENT